MQIAGRHSALSSWYLDVTLKKKSWSIPKQGASAVLVCFPVLTFLGQQLKQIPGGLRILNHIKSTEASYYWQHFLKSGGKICFLSIFCPSVDSISLRWRLQSEKQQLRTARLCPETWFLVIWIRGTSGYLGEESSPDMDGPEYHVFSIHCA